MTTPQRFILALALGVLAAMLIIVPVDFGNGYTWTWDARGNMDYKRACFHLICWLFATILAMIMAAPVRRIR